ncbi:MAG: transcriptional regulator, ArsR family [Herbinix sp.]|jgi:predicted transcriptional regulator|nr:transcriptional regulator, ArsR family [Herbinix sp.]
MTEAEAIKIFKCLADRSRLLILKSLVEEDMYVERLAKRLELASSTVSFHLKKLEDAGIVASRAEQYYAVYYIKEEILNTKILDIIREKSSESNLQKEREDEYRRKVIDSFFEYGKLKSIPVQRKKELIVLEEIVKAFEVGKKYTEREVNILLADYFDDFCTLRKDIVTENLLIRDNNVYRLKDESIERCIN